MCAFFGGHVTLVIIVVQAVLYFCVKNKGRKREQSIDIKTNILRLILQ